MKIENLIINIIVGFNLLTVLIYLLQPFGGNGVNIITLLFVLLNILMMYKGYKKGLSRYNNLHEKVGNHEMSNESRKRLINFFFVFYILTFSIRYSYELYCAAFDFTALLSRIMIGVYDPQLGYTLKGIRMVPWTIYFIISIIDCLFIPITLLSWRFLNKFQKILLIVLLVSEVFFWLGKGTNFGVIIVLLSVLWAFFASYDKSFSLKKKNLLVITIVAIVGFVLALIVFNYNVESRTGGDFSRMSENNFTGGGGEYVNTNSILYKIVPENLIMSFLFIFSYLAGGYYNLEKMFECGITWTYGFGNNPSLYHLAGVIGIDASSPGYQMRIEQLYGVDSAISWHTGYLWLANDFTIIGVPIVIFLIGKIMGYSFSLYKNEKDLLSGIIFLIFANMMMLMFANNNYLSSVFYGFMFLFPYWLLKRYFKVG